MPELNQEYSPEGFVAVPAPERMPCDSCAFQDCSYRVCEGIACMPWERDDNSSVIFITKEEYHAAQN